MSKSVFRVREPKLRINEEKQEVAGEIAVYLSTSLTKNGPTNLMWDLERLFRLKNPISDISTEEEIKQDRIMSMVSLS